MGKQEEAIGSYYDNYLEGGYFCGCGEWVSYSQEHQCKGLWGGCYPPIKTVETCPHCGKIIEKWIDLNQEAKDG